MCVLARICSCCADKDIQDGVRAAILNYSFIHKIYRFHHRKEKLSIRPSRKGPERISSRQNSANRGEEQEIQDGVQPPFSIYCFFHKIIKVQSTQMKFDTNLPIEVLNNCMFSRICNSCGQPQYSRWRPTAILNHCFVHEICIVYNRKREKVYLQS